jgi:hypothetical protein
VSRCASRIDLRFFLSQPYSIVSELEVLL